MTTMQLLSQLKNVPREEGQSLIEYALIIAGMAMLIITGVFLYGNEVRQMYNMITTMADRWW